MTVILKCLTVPFGILTLIFLTLAYLYRTEFWRKWAIILTCLIIILDLKFGYWLQSVIWVVFLGLNLAFLFSNEKMKLHVKNLLLLAAVFIVLILPSSTVLHQVKTEVEIIKNINEDGWYWTQFQLPSGGELMAKASFEEYLYWRDLDLSRVEILGWRPFFGQFCPCGETIPNKYVFLPLREPEVSMLTFFSADGKTVWEIEVPEELHTPSEGETTTQANIYYH